MKNETIPAGTVYPTDKRTDFPWGAYASRRIATTDVNGITVCTKFCLLTDLSSSLSRTVSRDIAS